MASNPFPSWWPRNPYPEDVFPMTVEDYVRLIPDEQTRTALSGCLGRLFWDIASESILEAWMLEQARDHAGPVQAVCGQTEKTMEEPNNVTEAKDAEKPEDEQTRLRRFVIRLCERVENADDWASDEKYRSVAAPLTQLSECCNADDIYLDAVGLLIEHIDRIYGDS